MRTNAMRNNYANRLRTRDDPVVVVIDRRIIFIKVVAELCCVTLEQKVLQVQVRDRHLLMAVIERVQPTIGVFLQVIEVREVVLILV